MQNSDIINYFAKYIQRELGIVYSEHNLYQLQNRLEEVIKILKIPDLLTLYHYVESNNPLFKKQVLLDIATNNETSFFRDPRVFRGIGTILTKILERLDVTREELKIWSVASSTGQEPISVSILLEELYSEKNFSTPYSLLCSDISQRVLDRAREASYSELEMSRGLDKAQINKYFKQVGNRWHFDRNLLSKMTFVKQNLKDSFSDFGQFHLVLCRNVLIYQNVESKVEILQRLLNSIVPGGYLILGAGESLLGLTVDFEQVIVDGAVFYRRKA